MAVRGQGSCCVAWDGLGRLGRGRHRKTDPGSPGLTPGLTTCSNNVGVNEANRNGVMVSCSSLVAVSDDSP